MVGRPRSLNDLWRAKRTLQFSCRRRAAPLRDRRGRGRVDLSGRLTAVQSLCGVREWTILLTNRWSTRWEPIGRRRLQAHPCSGIQNPALRRPCTLRVLKSVQHGTGGGFFMAALRIKNSLKSENARGRPSVGAGFFRGANPGGAFFAPSIGRPPSQVENPNFPQLTLRQGVVVPPPGGRIDGPRYDGGGAAAGEKSGNDAACCRATASARRGPAMRPPRLFWD